MKMSTICKFEETKRFAETALRYLCEREIDDEMANHHIRNAVTNMRATNLKENSETAILQLCEETYNRIRPFFDILFPEPYKPKKK